MLDLSWPKDGVRHVNATAFLTLISQHEGFWAADFPLKYLGVQIDTRDGAFLLSDRDGNRIEADRVVCAIQKWRIWFGHR